jgi:hypothetical protein
VEGWCGVGAGGESWGVDELSVLWINMVAMCERISLVFVTNCADFLLVLFHFIHVLILELGTWNSYIYLC